MLCGAVLIALALQLAGSGGDSRRAASRLFAFSIVYLFMLFASLLVDHDSVPQPRGLDRGGARGAVVNVGGELRRAGVRKRHDSFHVRPAEA